MIRCIGLANGNGIFGSSTCKKSRPSRTCRSRIPWLIGTIRRECLDRTLFWTTADLEMKLLDFQRYYNGHRAHAKLAGRTPDGSARPSRARVNVSSYRWQVHCRGLYQTSIAA
jgi:Integrase core domain